MRALDIVELLPGLRWSAQIEAQVGRQVVRPRYELVRTERRHIVKVELENLAH